MKLKDYEIVKVNSPYVNRDTWVKVLIKIKKNETGEVVSFLEKAIWDNGLSFFIWEEGNYSCDCNRELFFEEAKGNEPDLDDTQCGDGRYSVNIYCPKTKECLYREFEEGEDK